MPTPGSRQLFSTPSGRSNALFAASTDPVAAAHRNATQVTLDRQRIRGIRADMVVLDEVSDLSPAIMQMLRVPSNLLQGAASYSGAAAAMQLLETAQRQAFERALPPHLRGREGTFELGQALRR